MWYSMGKHDREHFDVKMLTSKLWAQYSSGMPNIRPLSSQAIFWTVGNDSCITSNSLLNFIYLFIFPNKDRICLPFYAKYLLQKPVINNMLWIVIPIKKVQINLSCHLHASLVKLILTSTFLVFYGTLTRLGKKIDQTNQIESTRVGLGRFNASNWFGLVFVKIKPW